MVLRREFALTRVKRMAIWWFDFFGGFYYAPPLMKEVANMVRVQERLKDVPMRSAAQIAVFGDVASMYQASARSPLADDLLVQAPDELARIGAPYDIYNFSDIDHPRLPVGQYKLYVFLNAFLIPPEKRAFIRDKLQRDGRTLLWIYAPNYLQERGFSLDAISQLTGITVARREANDSTVRVPAEGVFTRLGVETRYAFRGRLSPLFEVRDQDAQVLGTYMSNGSPALASKKLARHTSVYSAVGNLPAAMFREIARAAGVHIYYEGHDPVYINSRLLGVHMQSAPTPVLTLPGGMNARLEELFDGGELQVRDGRCTIPHEPGAMKLYLIADGSLQAPRQVRASSE
jgi:hypothetical protein